MLVIEDSWTIRTRGLEMCLKFYRDLFSSDQCLVRRVLYNLSGRAASELITSTAAKMCKSQQRIFFFSMKRSFPKKKSQQMHVFSLIVCIQKHIIIPMQMTCKQTKLSIVNY